MSKAEWITSTLFENPPTCCILEERILHLQYFPHTSLAGYQGKTSDVKKKKCNFEKAELGTKVNCYLVIFFLDPRILQTEVQKLFKLALAMQN